MVTQGQNYITNKKITIPKITEKNYHTGTARAVPVMEISRFGNQHIILWYDMYRFLIVY